MSEMACNGGNSANGGASCNCGCGCAHGPKFEEIVPLPGVQYCTDSPPWLDTLALGFQHYIITLGTTALISSIFVNELGGSNVEKAKVFQCLLFVSGVNTLLQTLFGTRLPSVIVGSYSYITPMISILQAKRHNTLLGPYGVEDCACHRFEQTMRSMQGALLVASCFQMLVGFLGVWTKVIRFLTPLSTGPLVTFTGLGLHYLGFPKLMKCAEAGVPELVLAVFISQYLPSLCKTKRFRYLWDRFAILLSVLFLGILSLILTESGAYDHVSLNRQASCRTDRAGLMSGASWIYIPYPFQWGRPTFNPGEAFAIMTATMVASVESSGAFLATARYGSDKPVPTSILNGGVGWLGFGTLLSGMFGTVTGPTASVQNVGYLAMTRVGSRRVAQVSAGFMIFFSVLGKFGAIFASIPLPILAALYCIFFGYVSSAGLGLLQYCNLNILRTKFILGFSFFLGLSIPQYFREHQLSSGASPVHTPSRWFNDIITVIFTSHATVAISVSVILDRTLAHEPEGGKPPDTPDSNQEPEGGKPPDTPDSIQSDPKLNHEDDIPESTSPTSNYEPCITELTNPTPNYEQCILELTIPGQPCSCFRPIPNHEGLVGLGIPCSCFGVELVGSDLPCS
ncbi:Nucleobase-ascorbate transporter like [Actinidia chinensis var. chinensis]|uniref:Nucleobase-ascorbate transporter like n=1 Tax=Actinidia chinensis var. chinensis TaxID=1590841 RepID=A0A2R6RNC9_ACTCC|nr:Nucleobase-ascorbate transporter like [Actinidia chinensis var. chinensis]